MTTEAGAPTPAAESRAQSFMRSALAILGETGRTDFTVLEVVERFSKRLTVADTDESSEMRRQIEDLGQLIAAYRSGQVAEQGRQPQGPLQFD